MDASRLVEALRSQQGGGEPSQGRYRYGGMGGEPMQPQGQVQMQGPDLGALLAGLFGGGFGGSNEQPMQPAPSPQPSQPGWQERGFTTDGNMGEKNEIIQYLLGQMN